MREIMKCYVKSVFCNLKNFKNILMQSSLEYIENPLFASSKNTNRFSMAKDKDVPPQRLFRIQEVLSLCNGDYNPAIWVFSVLKSLH